MRGGAAGRREPPHDITVVTVKRVRLGRLLLFAVKEQVNDTNDQNADLNEIRITGRPQAAPTDITVNQCRGG